MREGWREVRLGDVANIQQGKTLSKTEMTGGNCPVYGANGIIGHFSKGHYGFSVVAVGCRGTCGSVHLAPPGSFLANNVMAVWPKTPSVTTDFLKIVFESISLKEEGIVSGQVQPQVTRASLSGLRLAVPPLKDQRQIVDLIVFLDDTIEAADAAYESAVRGYEEMGRSLDGVDFTLRAIGDLVNKAKAGGTPSRNVAAFYGGDVSWLKSGEVASSQIRTTEESITNAAVAGSSAWIAPADSTVVAMYGATAGQVGQIKEPMAMNQAVLALVPDTSVITHDYLYHAVKSQASALKAKARGAAQPNLSKEVVVGHLIAVPPIERQAVIASAFESAEAATSSTGEYLAKLRATRSELLAVLLSGEHEIPESYGVSLVEEAA